MSKKDNERPDFLLKRVQLLEKELGIVTGVEHNSYWESNNQPRWYFTVKILPEASVLESIKAISNFVGIEKIYKKYTPAKTVIKVKKRRVNKEATK